ncbi:MAG: V-type ATP synthase subunit E [Bacillota bacterium]|jgi:V/A-type H+-transporting ATPase subunit E|nr:hypothetical protein [Candidatus Fermentithermobacillaceae bacterium]
MPLEDILEKISERAASLKQEILASAKANAESRIEAAREEASRIEAEILREAEAQAEQVRSIAASRSDMQQKQMILEVKQELISQVFDEAVRRLADLPGDEYRALLIELIGRKADGSEELILSKHDESRLGADFGNAVNQALKAQGKAGKLKVSYVPDRLGGGFILKKGLVADNVTFPAILSLIREDLEIELAKVLFEEPEKESAT